MALYGEARDISMFRHVNRELMHNIISQQCVLYKYSLDETKTNIYGEASTEKYYHPPVILFCLVERQNQEYPEDEFGVNFKWGITFRFLRDDLLAVSAESPNGANIVPEVGDIILYQKGYYEVDSIISNQYFVGKNPDYPNYDDDGNNPTNPGLEDFGYNVAIICSTHYVPADKVGLTKERFWWLLEVDNPFPKLKRKYQIV